MNKGTTPSGTHIEGEREKGGVKEREGASIERQLSAASGVDCAK